MNNNAVLRHDLISAWCGPGFLITFVFFWGILGHNIPNPSPALTPEALSARYAENLGSIRAGFILSLISVVLYLPWTSLLTSQMARIEGAVRSAEQKGARNSVVMVDDLAVVVDIQQRMVVTAMEREGNRDRVFTNIDSVVIA